MRLPGPKRMVASILFLMLSISTFAFGTVLFVRTYEVTSFDGRTVLTGIVTDGTGAPLGNVEVTCSNVSDLTDSDGKFELGSVPEGQNLVRFYRPGFVLKEVVWVAYPMSELGTDPESSVNNISTGLELVLYREARTEYPMGGYANGTLNLLIREVAGISFPASIGASNGTGFRQYSVGAGQTIIEINGNGTFHLRWSDEGPVLTSFHPVGFTIDVTDVLMDLIGKGSTEWTVKGSLSVVITPPAKDVVLMLEVEDEQGDVISCIFPWVVKAGNLSTVRFELPPGVYGISIYGKGIVDTTYLDLPVTLLSPTEVNVTMSEPGRDKVNEGMIVEGNYPLAALNIVLAGLFMLGGVFSFMNGSWFVLMPIAFLGFVSNGTFNLPLDPNHLFAALLILLLLALFGESRRKRRNRPVT